MKRALIVLVAALAIGTGTAGIADASESDTTVYVYTDDPSEVAALCAQAQADWGPADHCRVLPARYADVSVGEAADIANGGW